MTFCCGIFFLYLTKLYSYILDIFSQCTNSRKRHRQSEWKASGDAWKSRLRASLIVNACLESFGKVPGRVPEPFSKAEPSETQ